MLPPLLVLNQVHLPLSIPFSFNIVNKAIINFALMYLPNLEFLSFRGELKAPEVQLLEQYHYYKIEELQFPLILRRSSMFHLYFVDLTEVRRKKNGYYISKVFNESFTEPSTRDNPTSTSPKKFNCW